MSKKIYRFINDRKKNNFLNKLIDCCGNIGKAAEKSGITRQTHYNWLHNDDRYAAVYENEIKPMCLSALEDEAHRRAMGYEEAVYYKGERVGTVTRYSDRLMELLLKANAPDKYRDRAEVKTIEGGGSVIAGWEDDGDG